MPPSISVETRSSTSATTARPSRTTLSGSGSSRTDASSGASRANRPRPRSISSTANGPRGTLPSHTCAAETSKLGSSRSCARSSTIQSSPPSGSRTRKHNRTRPSIAAPDATHSTTTRSNARTFSTSTDRGSQGSRSVNECTHASGTVRRPGRGPRRLVPASTSRPRTSESTAVASRVAATRCASTDESAQREAIRSRSPAEGIGHHHERARPSSPTASPGTNLPDSTRHRAAASASSSSEAIAVAARVAMAANHGPRRVL